MSSPTVQPALANHKSQNYNEHASFVYSDKNTAPILQLLNAKKGENVVDLGCGTGQLTEKIKALVGDGEVWGVDSSNDMLAFARKSGDALSITYTQGDIQDYNTLDPSLKGKFDAVFSSATLHWCKTNPGGVVETIKWLLKPGGRAVFEFGGFQNTVGVRGALHGCLRRRGHDPVEADPWYFPTAEQYTALLRRHGMSPGAIELHQRPTPLTTDLYGWLKTFARNTFLAKFSDEEADIMMREVVESCRPDNYWCDATPGLGMAPTAGEASNEGWVVHYVRLRGSAVAPS